ncbi:MAG: ROK family protein [Candidatus Altiarchaeota archaeon]
MANGSRLRDLTGGALQSYNSMEGLTPPKGIRREARVAAGIDIGGKYTKVLVESNDGRGGYAEVPTFKKSDDMPVEERVRGLVDSTMRAILAAAAEGGIEVSEIDAIGFGAPGARNPKTGTFRMPNAIGMGSDGKIAEVDFERGLRTALAAKGLKKDAHVRGGNDCDVAAAAVDLGEAVKTVKEGSGDWRTLEGGEESFYILLGTGIGVGWNTKDGINEGATGKMEGGHSEVQTGLEWITCGCGKPNHGSVCVEAVASTTGQEKIMKRFVQHAFRDASLLKADEMKILLDETRRWNQEKLGKGVSGEEVETLGKSIAAINAIMGRLEGRGDAVNMAALAEDIQFDCGIIHGLATGKNPRVSLCAEVTELAGQHLGRYMRNTIMLRNPKRIVIGGGGGRTFNSGDETTNPFWRGMMSELRDEYDPFGSIRDTWIIMADKDKNLGIDGSLRLARLEYARKAP